LFLQEGCACTGGGGAAAGALSGSRCLHSTWTLPYRSQQPHPSRHIHDPGIHIHGYLEMIKQFSANLTTAAVVHCAPGPARAARIRIRAGDCSKARRVVSPPQPLSPLRLVRALDALTADRDLQGWVGATCGGCVVSSAECEGQRAHSHDASFDTTVQHAAHVMRCMRHGVCPARTQCTGLPLLPHPHAPLRSLLWLPLVRVTPAMEADDDWLA
jgi:hypothetical protein